MIKNKDYLFHSFEVQYRTYMCMFNGRMYNPGTKEPWGSRTEPLWVTD